MKKAKKHSCITRLRRAGLAAISAITLAAPCIAYPQLITSRNNALPTGASDAVLTPNRQFGVLTTGTESAASPLTTDDLMWVVDMDTGLPHPALGGPQATPSQFPITPWFSVPVGTENDYHPEASRRLAVGDNVIVAVGRQKGLSAPQYTQYKTRILVYDLSTGTVAAVSTVSFPAESNSPLDIQLTPDETKACILLKEDFIVVDISNPASPTVSWSATTNGVFQAPGGISAVPHRGAINTPFPSGAVQVLSRPIKQWLVCDNFNAVVAINQIGGLGPSCKFSCFDLATGDFTIDASTGLPLAGPFTATDDPNLSGTWIVDVKMSPSTRRVALRTVWPETAGQLHSFSLQPITGGGEDIGVLSDGFSGSTAAGGITLLSFDTNHEFEAIRSVSAPAIDDSRYWRTGRDYLFLDDYRCISVSATSHETFANGLKIPGGQTDQYRVDSIAPINGPIAAAANQSIESINGHPLGITAPPNSSLWLYTRDTKAVRKFKTTTAGALSLESTASINVDVFPVSTLNCTYSPWIDCNDSIVASMGHQGSAYSSTGTMYTNLGHLEFLVFDILPQGLTKKVLANTGLVPTDSWRSVQVDASDDRVTWTGFDNVAILDPPSSLAPRSLPLSSTSNSPQYSLANTTSVIQYDRLLTLQELATTTGGRAGIDGALFDLSLYTDEYCLGTQNSLGFRASLVHRDLSLVGPSNLSISTNSFALSCTGAIPGEKVHIYASPNWSTARMFLASSLCISPVGYSVLGSPVADASGSASLPVDLALGTTSFAPSPGTTWSFQALYRDPSSGSQAPMATSASRFTFVP